MCIKFKNLHNSDSVANVKNFEPVNNSRMASMKISTTLVTATVKIFMKMKLFMEIGRVSPIRKKVDLTENL